MSRKLIACSVLCFGWVCGFIPSVPFADSPPNIQSAQTVVDPEYQRDLQRLRDFRQHRDLKGLENLAEEIQAKWSRRDEQPYFDLMAIVVSQFNSYLDGFAPRNQQYLLAQKYARLALQKSDKMSLETQTQFLYAFINDPEYDNGSVQGDQWSRIRNEKVQMLLIPLQRFDQQIDRDYDFEKDITSLYPPRPLGMVVWRSNMSSKAIKERISDPEILAEYELAVAEYNEKIKQRSTQYELRRLEQSYLSFIGRYLIKAYSKPPYNTEELKHYLDLYVQDKVRQTRILDQIERRTSTKPFTYQDLMSGRLIIE